MVKKDIGLLDVNLLEEKLKEEIIKRAKKLNIPEEKIEKMLNKEYSFITSGVFRRKDKDKNEMKFLGFQLIGYRKGKRDNKRARVYIGYIKNREEEDLNKILKELVKIYKAYTLTDTIKDTLSIIE